MSKKLLVLLLFFCLNRPDAVAQGSFAGASSQSLTNVSSGTVSSNTGSSDGGGIVSPDLFTGTANVNIPIYSYTVDGLDLSVSLGYNTAGIKVDQTASVIGLGWSLNFGPVITREVKGIEDEFMFEQIDTTSTSGVAAIAVPEMKGYLINPAYTTFRDDIPDVFSVSLGGRSIKFTFDNYGVLIPNQFRASVDIPKGIVVDVFVNDRNIYTAPAPNNHRISEVLFHTSTDALTFRITDEHGNQFFFERGEVQVRRYTYSTFHPLSAATAINYVIPTSWVISKIITYTGAIITYENATDPISYPAYQDQRVLESDDYVAAGSSPATLFGGIGIINERKTVNTFQHRPVKITYPNGDVVSFIQDATTRLDLLTSSPAKPIKSIKIAKGYDATVKNSFLYNLNYAYYNSDAAQTNEVSFASPPSISDPSCNLRLKLKSIDKVGTDNTTTERYYTFSYLDADRMPARLSGITDCYGYYNGKALSSGVVVSPSSAISSAVQAELAVMNIPYHNFTFDNGVSSTHVSCDYGRDLTPDWNYAKTGLLCKIANGKGGSISLNYKEHSLSNPPDFQTPITNTGYFDLASSGYAVPNDLQFKDANDGVCISDITYEDGYNADNISKVSYDFTNGLRFFVGGYFWIPTFFRTNTATSVNDVAEKIYQGSFTNPIEYVNGCNHGYSNVRVTTKGYSGAVIGRKDYYFSNVQARPGEEIEGRGETGSWGSRLKVRVGVYRHTLSRSYFNRQYLGLVKSEADYDAAGTLLAKTENVYKQMQRADSPMHEEGFTCRYDNFTSASPKYGQGPIHTESELYTYYTQANMVLAKTTRTTYSGSASMVMATEMSYDGDGDMTMSTSTNSKGETTKEERNYTTRTYTIEYDYGTTPSTPNSSRRDTLKWLFSSIKKVGSNIVDFERCNILAGMIDQIYDEYGNPVGYTNGATLYDAAPLHRVRRDKVEKFFSNTPLPSASGHLIMTKHFIACDDHGNVIETGYNEDRKFCSAIWDTRIGEKVANVINAHYEDIAYSSFEGGYIAPPATDFNRGNWDFHPGYVVTATTSASAMTGRYYYNLGLGIITSANVPASGKNYVVSVWYKGPIPTITLGSSAVTVTPQITVGSWRLATAIVTGDGTNKVTVSGNTLIDELRMHPADAAMTTTTYEPLLGISSLCNERNNIIYYEYDAMGRQKVVRDINGKIMTLTKTVVQGSDN